MEVVRLDVCASTNVEARGRPVGTAVVARSQTRGRGRLDHCWESPIGGLYVSLVMPPAEPPTLYQFWAAVVVHDAVREAGLIPELRWPNDVLVDGRKVAGILSEALDDRAIVGIGVNVNNAMEPRPFGATSMAERLGRAYDIETVLATIVDGFVDIPPAAGVMDMWRERASIAGKRVAVRTLAGMVDGEVDAVADDGALMVRTERGTARVVEGECRYIG
ncbi:MAG: biotin--[acetyl-CoA-carboxylase] ligase [Thermoplasmata archaeon]|nr:biotin--[acetyl-CoA-carboxylase] ligase [Thermoplasmata archaeon]